VPHRYRQVVAITCTRCGTEASDGARFCSACGAPFEAPAGAERKLATMMFADLVGSTELATGLDPEELRRRLVPFFDLASTTLAEHGGTVEKYIGDAVMAVFGVPTAHGDDPDRAVAAGLALVERVGGEGNGLAVRIGIETGEVLAVEPGGALTVTGEAVNAAARLQSAAAQNEVLVGARAARSCRAARLEPRMTVGAKGFPVPLRAWRAVGVGLGRPRVETPFVGRNDDLDLLRLVYRRAVRERIPELVTITGEAGIGKTRLATELVDSLGGEDPCPEVLLGRNPPYGRGIAFWALVEILRAAARATPDCTVREVHDLLEHRLADLGAEDADEVAGALAAAVGGAESDGDVEDDLRRGWRRLVALLAAERPLIIALDDAHWADDGVLDLVEEVAFGLEDSPVLLMCTARPELLERRPDFGRAARNITQIELRPLRLDTTAELAATLLPDQAPDLARRVAEVSGGNPFFTEEVARTLVEERGDDGHRLPDTVQAAISARLDLLPLHEKRVLQHAAVLGQRFPEARLTELLGAPLGDALESLAQKALVQERLATEPGRWGFRHQLIRDVAYSSLPRAERARLHERAAEAIAGGAGERHAELAELMAFHRVQAAELDATPERSAAGLLATLEAAEVVFRRGASVRSQELYEQAAELATSATQRIDALRAAANVATRRLRGDEAVRLLRTTAKVAQEIGDTASAAAAYARAVEIAARMAGITGRMTESELRGMLRQGQDLAEHADPVTRTRLVLDEAWIAWFVDRNEDMAEPAQRGLEMARKLDDPTLLSGALDAASASAWWAGRYREATEQTRERLAVLDQAPSDPEIDMERSDALHMMVECLVQVGNYREAREYATKAREGDLDRGIVYSGWSRTMLPSFFLGDWDEVLAMGKRVREAWTAQERPPSAFLAGSVATAGAVLGYRGDERGFESWMTFAEEMGGGGGQAMGIRMLQADVLLHRGLPAEALEALTGGRIEFLFWWQPMYLATLAEVSVAAGSENAAAALAQAEEATGDNRYAQAMAVRTRGRLEGDERMLREALARFHEIQCPYQAARTAWLLGGDARAEAEGALKRLGATPPG
jgi:class 3 adenylate cyclase/tetratricopeptide (TPR) repeat protein